jgi:hypothetical protein
MFAQDRPIGTVSDGAFDRSRYGGWERNQDDLAALASHAQDAVAVLFAEQEDAQVRLAMLPGQAAIATEVGGHRRAQDELTRGRDTDAGDRERSHTLPCVTSPDEHQNSRRGMTGRSIGCWQPGLIVVT